MSEPPEGRRILGDLAAAGIATPDGEGRATPPVCEPLPEGPFTLDSLLALAESRSPRLAAARSRIGVAAGMAWQSSLYPNPRGEAWMEDLSTERGTDAARYLVGISQPIVVGDRLSAAEAAGLARRAAAAAELEAERRKVLEEVETLFTRSIAAGEALQLIGELSESVDRTLVVAQGRFQAGAAPESDVVRPRIEQARFRQESGRLRRDQQAAAARLSVLVGAAIQAADLRGELPRDAPAIDEAVLGARLRESHPSLLAARAQVAAEEARLRHIRAEVTPDVDVRVAAGYDEEMTDGVLQLGAGMTIPLWDRRQGDILAARFAVAAARQGVLAAENELVSDLVAAAAEYQSAAERWRISLDDVIPAAQQSFELSGGAYRAGRGSFIDVLDAQRTLIEARLMAAREAEEAAMARVRLKWLAGEQ